jgi:hypothetical protein
VLCCAVLFGSICHPDIRPAYNFPFERMHVLRYFT